jgi:hypothetical protein
MKTLKTIKNLERLTTTLARKDAEKARGQFRRMARSGKHIVQHLAINTRRDVREA